MKWAPWKAGGRGLTLLAGKSSVQRTKSWGEGGRWDPIRKLLQLSRPKRVVCTWAGIVVVRRNGFWIFYSDLC